MPKKPVSKPKDPPIDELYIHGEVASWHVIAVAHDKMIEVLRDQAQYEEKKPDGSIVYTHRAVSDHFSLELDLALRTPVRGFERLETSITTWDAAEYGGIAGDLHYDKERGMHGSVHMSGSFPRDLYQMLLSGSNTAMCVETGRGFYRRKARVESLAFSDTGHPQWNDEESGLI